MFLTICDLVCRSYPYINRIFFYDCKDDYNAVVASLRHSLGKVLVKFFPLAGRLAFDEDGRLEIDCNDAGVDFVEAVAHLPFSDLQCDGFQYRNLFWKLARRTELLRSDYTQLPILSIQVTKFEGGGLSIGVSLSHTVADAQSFYDFVGCWGENCRGVPMSVPPKHLRTALRVESLFPVEPTFEDALLYLKKRVNGSHLIAELASYEKQGKKSSSVTSTELQQQPKQHGEKYLGVYKPNPATEVVEKPERIAPIMEKQHEEEEHRRPRTDLVQKVFSFSGEALQRLKKRAASSEGSVEVAYTTFESFCAHWWQCLIRARDLPDENPVFLLVPINCRQRFLSLPKGYFGNSLDGALAKSTASELCSSDLTSIAGKIHEAIMSVTEDSFRGYIKKAESKRNAIPHFDRRGLFHVVDSPKYAVYDVDFGWGKPSAVRAEGFRFGAEVQLLAGRNGEGSIDLFCALDAKTMKRLEDDPEFLAC